MPHCSCYACRQFSSSNAMMLLETECAPPILQVWDCRRLEKDVSFRSRLTYAAQGACHSWLSCRRA